MGAKFLKNHPPMRSTHANNPEMHGPAPRTSIPPKTAKFAALAHFLDFLFFFCPIPLTFAALIM